MKRMVLVSFMLLLLLVCASLADTAKYQIYSESKGFLGTGGHKVIMLDKESGDSWIYTDDKWVPIVKEVSNESTAADDVRAQLEAEITALKDKQAQEISDLKAKQEEELKVLNAKLEANKPAAAAQARPAVHRTRPVYARKKAAPKPADENQDENSGGSSGDEAPPAWLSE